MLAALAVFVLTISLAPAAGQQNNLPPNIPRMAALVDGKLVIYDLNGPVPVTLPDDQVMTDITWAVNGRMLAFRMFDPATGEEAVWAYDIVENYAAGRDASYLPAAFGVPLFRGGVSPLYYTAEAEVGEDGALTVGVYNAFGVYNPARGRQITLARIPQTTVDCEPLPPNPLLDVNLPLDDIYYRETGPGYGANRYFHAWTAAGNVYTLGCDGIGIGIVNLDEETSAVLNETVRHATLNPDRTQVAALDGEPGDERIVVIDLPSGEISATFEDLPLEPDQLHWGADGAIYFTTRLMLDATMPLDADQSALVEASTGVSLEWLPRFATSIIRLDPAGGTQTEIYVEADAWGIGRMFTAGEQLYFSRIPGAAEWLEALAAGETVTAPDLYFMPLAGGDAAVAGEGIALATVRPDPDQN
jgi:hypothetical protein